MNLYESISKSINEKKDTMEVITKAKEEYTTYVNERDDLYIKIVGLCPTITEDDDDVLDFLRYLRGYLMLENIHPRDAIETYLISKDYKDKTEDFDKLVDLIIDFTLSY